jgi:hypothetical protein
MRNLSDDAKGVAAALFPHKNKVRFLLQVNRPTARFQAALDELEKGDYILKRVEDGVVSYYSTTDFSDEKKWFAENGMKPGKSFALMEPIKKDPVDAK